jgi:hypothetical protein
MTGRRSRHGYAEDFSGSHVQLTDDPERLENGHDGSASQSLRVLLDATNGRLVN